MKIIKMRGFKEMVLKEDDNISTLKNLGRNKHFKNFKIKCSKCGSFKTLVETSFSYSNGSEYTGIYGEEVTLLIKCLDCGNAESITAE